MKQVAFLGQRLLGPLALVGVTDGSDAAPGMVGEVLFNVNTAGVNVASGGSNNIVNLALTPGDWDVNGLASDF